VILLLQQPQQVIVLLQPSCEQRLRLLLRAPH
jgi:hypothetical protein